MLSIQHSHIQHTFSRPLTINSICIKQISEAWSSAFVRVYECYLYVLIVVCMLNVECHCHRMPTDSFEQSDRKWNQLNSKRSSVKTALFRFQSKNNSQPKRNKHLTTTTDSSVLWSDRIYDNCLILFDFFVKRWVFQRSKSQKKN